ncbi:MAG: TIGR01621 family pseudouridine synthase [Enterobacterales bacterium]|nr:TIGR01621 family pseudouridine synthase [Enterobacterales bacterium]
MSDSFYIIEENDDFVIVDKPPKIDCHQTKSKQDDQSTGLFYRLSQQLNIPLWPVHRLDKMTSGLLIMAKTKPAAQAFGQLFESHQVKKTYLAISNKKPKKKQGKIVGDMKKSRSGNWKLCHSHDNPAITRFVSYPLPIDQRLFIIHPKTGRTHQIRVALKSIAAPILGDPRYAAQSKLDSIDRGYLHAFQLGFKWQGKSLLFSHSPTHGVHFYNLTVSN